MTDTAAAVDATGDTSDPTKGAYRRLGGAYRRLGGGYWRLWSAAVLSRLGDAVRTPALALLTASLTRDPRTIAVVVVAGQLPPLLFGLIGGVYADRWDRRRTMAVVDGLRAVLVGAFAVLVATGRTSIAVLAGCAFLLATLGTLFDASAFAILPGLVPADRLATANGRLQAGTALASGFVGAPAAGVLFAIAAALPFAVDAMSFAVAALLALTLRPTRPTGARQNGARRNGAGAGSVPRGRSLWREAGDGLRWIRRDGTLCRITVLAAVTNLAISAMIATLVLYALDVLKVSEAGYGAFMAVAVVGALIGALGAGRLARRFGALSGLRWVLLGQTVALAGLALSRHPVPGALTLAVFSAGTAVWNALWAAYGQRNVPAELLGRVGSAQRMAGMLTAPIGAALGGFVAEAYGLPVVVYAAAVILALATTVAWRTLSRGGEPGRVDSSASTPTS
ncbi:MFS transporter [Micromonospora sonneratiae]|uniref:MFS transporter n=1 Tax=Micromonospora sonneratiae TaxID=1184706 RepID=A0ABW3Y9N5_9ACTN